MLIAPPGMPLSEIASFPCATQVPLSSGSAGAPVQVIGGGPASPAPLLLALAPPAPELDEDEVSLLPPQATRAALITRIEKARRMGAQHTPRAAGRNPGPCTFSLDAAVIADRSGHNVVACPPAPDEMSKQDPALDAAEAALTADRPADAIK